MLKIGQHRATKEESAVSNENYEGLMYRESGEKLKGYWYKLHN
jgi:hypothetical protein